MGDIAGEERDLLVDQRRSDACPPVQTVGPPGAGGDARAWYDRCVLLLPVAANLHDRSGRVLAVNQRMTELFGYTIDDIPTIDDWWRLAFPDPAFRRFVVDVWRERAHSVPLDGTGVVVTAEFEFRAKDGSSRWAEMRSFVDGELFVTLLLDMTKRHEAEDELRRQRRDYETIFNLV
ncbi:PAS domain S-box protein, partial [bacterium]|nr:PAS domain S-box protein [bacterium]